MKPTKTKVESLRLATVLSFLSLMLVKKIFAPNDHDPFVSLLISSVALCSFIASIYFAFNFLTKAEDITNVDLQVIFPLSIFGAIALYLSITNFQTNFSITPILSLSHICTFIFGLASIFYAIRLAFWKYILKKQQPSA